MEVVVDVHELVLVFENNLYVVSYGSKTPEYYFKKPITLYAENMMEIMLYKSNNSVTLNLLMYLKFTLS